eukprot:284814663_5
MTFMAAGALLDIRIYRGADYASTGPECALAHVVSNSVAGTHTHTHIYAYVVHRSEHAAFSYQYILVNTGEQLSFQRSRPIRHATVRRHALRSSVKLNFVFPGPTSTDVTVLSLSFGWVSQSFFFYHDAAQINASNSKSFYLRCISSQATHLSFSPASLFSDSIYLFDETSATSIQNIKHMTDRTRVYSAQNSGCCLVTAEKTFMKPTKAWILQKSLFIRSNVPSEIVGRTVGTLREAERRQT